MELKPIGKIHTPFSSKKECPIQPLYASGAEGRVELFQPFDQGLKDIKGWTAGREIREKPPGRE